MASTTISPKDISELRARTGAGMMDCKRALEEAGGEMDKAAETLRKKGIAKAESVRAKIVDGKLKKFIAERTLLEQPYIRDDKKTVGDLVKEASGKLGEVITVRRFARFQVGAA